MDDKWEVDYGLKPTEDDADEDLDSDGLSNAEEYNLRTLPNNRDSDGDGLDDSEEVRTWGTNPNSVDSDGDGFSDKWEVDNGFPATDSLVGLAQYAVVNWWLIVAFIGGTTGALLVLRKYLEIKLNRTHLEVVDILDEIHNLIGELKDIGGRRVYMELDAASKRIEEIESQVTRHLEEAQLKADLAGSTRYRDRIDLYTMTLNIETRNARNELGISSVLDMEVDE
jgi:hypothetical protein